MTPTVRAITVVRSIYRLLNLGDLVADDGFLVGLVIITMTQMDVLEHIYSIFMLVVYLTGS